MDIQNYNFWASLKINLSVTSVPVQLPPPPGFLTHSGCGYNTVSCTEIDSSVFRCQAAELHVGCAGGFVYSQCGLALELLIVLSITTSRINPSNPLKSLSRPLLHPVHPVAGEGVARSLAGYLHWSPRLHQLRSRLLQLDLAMDTYGEKALWMSLSPQALSPLQIWNWWAPYLQFLTGGKERSSSIPWLESVCSVSVVRTLYICCFQGVDIPVFSYHRLRYFAYSWPGDFVYNNQSEWRKAGEEGLKGT